MAEFRYDPFTSSWVIIASSRQARPTMPKDYCAFCPGSGKVPDEGYKVMRYPNDFPAMQLEPKDPDDVANDFFKVMPTYGKCEVILYSDDHNGSVATLDDEHIDALGLLWKEIFEEYKKEENIKYAFIFENKGEEVGTTMPHPHGQSYGYGFIPEKIETELTSGAKYYEEEGKCLWCDFIENEIKEDKRVIFETDHFIVILPFFSQYPYGVYLFSKDHAQSFSDFDDAIMMELSRCVRSVARMFDCIFDRPFPYMMGIHNAPVDGKDYSDVWHFHIEFFPPLRDSNKIKFNASSETACWAHCNPTCPEEKAVELRQAYNKSLERQW